MDRRNAQHFLDRRHSPPDLVQPAVPQRPHPQFDGLFADIHGMGPGDHHVPDVVGDRQYLVERDPSPVAGLGALVAPLAVKELQVL